MQKIQQKVPKKHQNYLKEVLKSKCFIKINKVDDISPLMKCYDATTEDEEVGKIVSNDCDNDNIEVPKDNVKEFEETNEISISEPKTSTPIIENNLCDIENDSVSEVQKVNDGSVFKSLLELSQPKNNIKRQTKLKNLLSIRTCGACVRISNKTSMNGN